MAGVTVGPHRDIESGDLVSDGVPSSAGICDQELPDVEHVLASPAQVEAAVNGVFENLVPRVESLEEETDGLVNGADPLSYYILAKGT